MLPLQPREPTQLNRFLEAQKEQVPRLPANKPTTYLSEQQRLDLIRSGVVKGTVTVGGERYLVAGAAKIDKRPGTGFVLLRPASLKTAGWGPFLQALS